jgi:hypothetical protein
LTEQRRAGLGALYLGIFAVIWFSVPESRPWLVAGAVASILTAVAGALLFRRAQRAGSGPRDVAADRRYLLIVAAEVGAAVLGAVVLGLAGWSEYTPVLIAAVVGLHFLPLAPLLRSPGLRLLGLAVCVVAVAGLITGLATSVSPAEVVGTGNGVLLLGYAIGLLVRSDSSLRRLLRVG